ncbi:MAG: formate dehydrogenase subunit delta [Pseudomonadota bacterium]
MTVPNEKLIKMAEQIAANVTLSREPETVATATVDHIQRFWDPRMRQNFLSIEPSTLSEVLALAQSKMNT